MKCNAMLGVGALALGGLLSGCVTSEVRATEQQDGTRSVTESCFLSPLWARGSTAESSWWTVPPLLSWGTGSVDEEGVRSDFVALLLGINYWSTRGEDLTSFGIFPLYAWWEGGSWLTLLGGRIHSDDVTWTYFTPLVGVTSGARAGGWVFPLWSRAKDADFGEKLALFESSVLPDTVTVTTETNLVEQSEAFGRARLVGPQFVRLDETAALLHDVDHVVIGCNPPSYGSETNTYALVEGYKRGNILLFNYSAERVVTYDLKTRQRLADMEASSSSFLLGIYRYISARSRNSEAEFTSHRLLWRLFRYEYDPSEGTSVDFLFIPVWR